MMAIGAGFWWILTRSVSYFWPSIWVTAVCGLQLIRVLHIRRFLKFSEEQRGDCISHVKQFWLLGSLSALTWSSALLFFYNPVNESFFIVYAFVTAGIACVAISSLAYVPKTYPIFSLPSFCCHSPGSFIPKAKWKIFFLALLWWLSSVSEPLYHADYELTSLNLFLLSWRTSSWLRLCKSRIPKQKS